MCSRQNYWCMHRLSRRLHALKPWNANSVDYSWWEHMKLSPCIMVRRLFVTFCVVACTCLRKLRDKCKYVCIYLYMQVHVLFQQSHITLCDAKANIQIKHCLSCMHNYRNEHCCILVWTELVQQGQICVWQHGLTKTWLIRLNNQCDQSQQC